MGKTINQLTGEVTDYLDITADAEMEIQLDGETTTKKVKMSVLAAAIEALIDAGAPAGAFPHDSEFTAANGTLLTAYTPDAGNAWTEQLGTAEIQSNKHSSKTFSSNVQVSLVDLETTDYTLTVKWQKPLGTANLAAYVFFRQIDASNKMFISISTTLIELYKAVAGVFTAIGGSPYTPVGVINDTNEHTAVLTVSGNLVSCTIDGNVLFASQPIDVALAAATLVGVGSSNSVSASAGEVVFNSVTAV